MKNILANLLALAVSSSLAVAQTSILYHEDWGAGVGGTNATTLASVGWKQVLVPSGYSGIYQYGSPRDANNGVPLPANILYFGGNAGLGIFYTTNGAGGGTYGGAAFTAINPAQFTNLQFSVECQWGYQGQYLTCWFAVQVGGVWYVSTNQPVTSTEHGSGDTFGVAAMTYNPGATNWNLLTASPAVQVGTRASSNLDGSITGIGLVTSLSNSGSWNYSLFKITGVPLWTGNLSVAPRTNPTTLTLTWPSSPVVRLQSSTNLMSPAYWTDVPNTIAQNSSTVATTNAAKFFRLSTRTAIESGGDITTLAVEQQHGSVYSDTNGVVASEPLALCKKYGWTVARVDLYVNPPMTDVYVNDLTYCIALAQRAKAQGLKVLLDLHYTDYTGLPAAWTNQTYSQLLTTVSNYTVNVMNSFAASKATPDFVQVGNEIGNGNFFPVGGPIQFTNGVPGPPTQWSQFIGLTKAGIAGVKAASPSARVMIHIPGGNYASWCVEYFDAFTAACPNFDLIGLSYYPSMTGTNTTDLSDITTTLNALHNRYYPRQLWITETSYMWNWGNNNPPAPQFPNTPSGQAAYADALCQLVASFSDGGGVCWWGGFEVANDAFQESWNSQALFDSTWYSPDGGTTWLVNTNHMMLPAFTKL